jgi:hypothetical protein
VESISPLRTDIDAPTKPDGTQLSAESSAQISGKPQLTNSYQSIDHPQSAYSQSQSTAQSRASRTSTSLSEASSSRKRKSEQGEESSNKRVKATLNESSAMVQSALYAAERMSDAIWISHAINLVIIGEPSRSWLRSPCTCSG